TLVEEEIAAANQLDAIVELRPARLLPDHRGGAPQSLAAGTQLDAPALGARRPMLDEAHEYVRLGDRLAGGADDPARGCRSPRAQIPSPLEFDGPDPIE